jgi:hypothetical protein
MKLLKMLFNIESYPDITVAAAQIRPFETNSVIHHNCNETPAANKSKQKLNTVNNKRSL